MFILAWIVMIVMQANAIVIPGLVAVIISVLAALELSVYVLVLLFNLIVFAKLKK